MKKITYILILFSFSCSQLNQWESGQGAQGSGKGHGAGGRSGRSSFWGSGSKNPDADSDPLLDRIGNDPFQKFYQSAFNKVHGKRFSSKTSGGPGGLCARYVDIMLVSKGCMSSRVHANAKQMPSGLRKKGFRDIGSMDVCKAKVGDVIVYGGSGYGHIEIKTPRGYLSDYLTTIPRFAGITDESVINHREYAMGMGRPSKTHCGNGAGSSRPVIAILRPPAGCI